VTGGQQYIDYIQGWAGNYGILLGPIAGIMIANYWLVRKQKLDMSALYTKGSGAYWFRNGWSVSAYVALVLTWVVCYIIAALLGQMAYVGVGAIKIPFPGGVIWYFSVVVAILLEWFFAGILQENKAQ
jgi:NCS1 family nucleobase:cation symporter-1